MKQAKLVFTLAAAYLFSGVNVYTGGILGVNYYSFYVDYDSEKQNLSEFPSSDSKSQLDPYSCVRSPTRSYQSIDTMNFLAKAYKTPNSKIRIEYKPKHLNHISTSDCHMVKISNELIEEWASKKTIQKFYPEFCSLVNETKRKRELKRELEALNIPDSPFE